MFKIKAVFYFYSNILNDHTFYYFTICNKFEIVQQIHYHYLMYRVFLGNFDNIWENQCINRKKY